MNDEDRWLRQAAEGDREAFDALVHATAPAVWQLTQRLTASRAAAEDAMQETFLATWRSAAHYRGDGSARAFVYGIARRQAARTFRRRAGEPVWTESLSELATSAGWGDDPELMAIRAEDRRRVLAAVHGLSDTDQHVITRCDLEGAPQDQVALEAGIAIGTLRVRLHRARLRLMGALREVDDE